MPKKQEYTLDVSKWRSGGHGEYKLGEGETCMLNSEGYMCCLGQFATQKDVNVHHLLGRADPENVAVSLNKMYNSNFIYDDNFLMNCETSITADYHNVMTELAHRAISINDNPSTTVPYKLQALIDVFEKEGITLKIVNGETYGYP